MFEYCRLYVGQRQSLDHLMRRLLELGYARQDEVADPGELAVHGGVLDLFPATFESPLRVELDGARIASIRSFNPQTLETLDRHAMAVILPRRVHATLSVEVPFEAFVDLQEGDYAVHLEHGIGRYLGRTTIAGSSGPQDALILEYADGDRLYVPMEQLHLVQKYVAFGGRRPAVHKLGGAAWERAKTTAYIGAWTYAKALLDLEARRLALPGHAFAKDHEWQCRFEAAFPHRETPDQLTATAEVKRGMEEPRPMDRVLLGDVGYGKTEVAVRAAFKAVMEHKQAAVLVPTTILACQHHRTFTKRMQGFPVQVETLTRFQSEAEQRRILDALAAGRADIVIGTHRLLSGDVRFRDLGLLIVDEEQRFGVQDKERLKRWRSQLDVLTLSATPIPRTLYLSLAGARDLSLIATPPENRHPIETRVVEEDEAAMRRWILKELERRGQIYVIHNRVRTIQQVGRRLAALVPEARVGVAHGQMAEGELEQVMLAFIDGALDVLVSTTIVESGIDIPNANTLIVRSAEAFGLADLYQLRGRVGRFDRKAYAYLVVSKRAVLTAEARARLEAMTEHTALGSGFKIAMEDLKLRGAGNLLGVEQSGHVSAVGFDFYCRLLREAVGRIRNGAANAFREAKLTATGLALLVWIWGAAAGRAETVNRILAVVNDEIITEADVASHVQALLEDDEAPGRSGAAPADMRHTVLTRLIEQRLMRQEGMRSGITVTTSEIAERFGEIRKRFDSAQEFRASLAESGLSEEELKEQIRGQLIVQRVIETKVRSAVRVSPQEVAQALAGHPEPAASGERVRASHILIRIGEGRSEAQARALIDDIRRQLAQGAGFAVLAARYSEDAHREDGGRLGWVGHGELLPELNAALFSLKPGEVSEPIRTALGVHVIKAEERREPSALAPAEANLAAYQEVYQEKFQEAFVRWLEDLKRRAYIEIVNADGR